MMKLIKTPHSTDYVLQSTRIDLWCFSLNQAITPSHLALLSSDEQQRAVRFYFEKHRRRFIIARATLRMLLARYLAIPAEQLVFQYNAQGKPSLAERSIPLEFNLSHSKDTALLAVGLTHPIGIDIEYFSERPYLGIAKQLFSITEQTALQALPYSLQPLAFFHVWSQKEAYIKAIGLGLSYPTQQFTVPMLPPTDDLIFDSEQASPLKIYSFLPEPTCCAALCYHPSIHDVYFYSLT